MLKLNSFKISLSLQVAVLALILVGCNKQSSSPASTENVNADTEGTAFQSQKDREFKQQELASKEKTAVLQIQSEERKAKVAAEQSKDQFNENSASQVAVAQIRANADKHAADKASSSATMGALMGAFGQVAGPGLSTYMQASAQKESAKSNADLQKDLMRMQGESEERRLKDKAEADLSMRAFEMSIRGMDKEDASKALRIRGSVDRAKIAVLSEERKAEELAQAIQLVSDDPSLSTSNADKWTYDYGDGERRPISQKVREAAVHYVKAKDKETVARTIGNLRQVSSSAGEQRENLTNAQNQFTEDPENKEAQAAADEAAKAARNQIKEGRTQVPPEISEGLNGKFGGFKKMAPKVDQTAEKTKEELRKASAKVLEQLYSEDGVIKLDTEKQIADARNELKRAGVEAKGQQDRVIADINHKPVSDVADSMSDGLGEAFVGGAAPTSVAQVFSNTNFNRSPGAPAWNNSTTAAATVAKIIPTKPGSAGETAETQATASGEVVQAKNANFICEDQSDCSPAELPSLYQSIVNAGRIADPVERNKTVAALRSKLEGMPGLAALDTSNGSPGDIIAGNRRNNTRNALKEALNLAEAGQPEKLASSLSEFYKTPSIAGNVKQNQNAAGTISSFNSQFSRNNSLFAQGGTDRTFSSSLGGGVGSGGNSAQLICDQQNGQCI